MSEVITEFRTTVSATRDAFRRTLDHSDAEVGVFARTTMPAFFDAVLSLCAVAENLERERDQARLAVELSRFSPNDTSLNTTLMLREPHPMRRPE